MAGGGGGSDVSSGYSSGSDDGIGLEGGSEDEGSQDGEQPDGGEDDDEDEDEAGGPFSVNRASVPFFFQPMPPGGAASLPLSDFAMVWNLASRWMTPATTAFLRAEALQEGERAGAAGAGVRVVPATAAQAQARRALGELLLRGLPHVVSRLKIKVPVSDVNKKVSAVVDTFIVDGPVPSLKQRQWLLLLTALLNCLSGWQLPPLQASLGSGLPKGSQQLADLLREDLQSSVYELDSLCDLLLGELD